MDEFIKESFNINSFPQWNCPTCKKGVLEVNGDLKKEETAETLNSHNHPGFDYEYVSYTVFGTLKCNNSRCSEKVVISGNGRQEEACYTGQDGEYEEVSHFIIKPIFMHPPINIFAVNKTVPQEISKMLVKSFALFFCDDNACGNRIRAAVEVMLDQLYGPPEKFTNLFDRINSIQGLEATYKNQLTALRVLGNAATHGEGKLVRVDNLNAYKLLASILGKFYPLDDLDDISINLINAHGSPHDKSQLTDN